MYGKRLSCLAHILAAALLFPVSGRADLVQTVARVKPAVVAVGTFQKTRNPSLNFLGSGFALGDGRHVVTNAHVVPAVVDDDHREKLVVLAEAGNAPQMRDARTVALDREHDLALLEIEGAPLPALILGDSATVREGQAVAFTGFPLGIALGFHAVTHRGIVSAVTPVVLPGRAARQLDSKAIRRLQDAYDIFQLDATAYPGNSGSPLYDPESGTVYGIVNMVFVKGMKETALTSPSGITYAIPAGFIRDLLRELK